ncbi:hypothetical protein LTR37_014329 [Vermiconidia calcicola]|uniref:Uncharacterized protein n=1 Tax=Vermiconidia calcicola TaxID=1690605 RepID=A0ACC3MTS7_9PEZI|nr:hypothetical protein LTR37_014329 [Vermiconidia calcicola]
MARLNDRASTVASSRYPSATPGPDNTSDQENYDPDIDHTAKSKRIGGAMNPPPTRSSLPTPTSDGSGEARGQKRKRVELRGTRSSGTQADVDEDEDDEEAAAEEKYNRYFNPHQDPEDRRQIKRKSRALERNFLEKRDDLLRDDGDGLTKIIRDSNQIYQTVKQTNDATLDSRLLVNVSDLANKKTSKLVLNDSSIGIDVDEFLSKCITYMRHGGPQDDEPTSTRRRRTTRNRDDSGDEADDDIIGEPLDWVVLGQHACYPYNSRPCLPTFLLGPLSVEKKQRTQTQRRARQSKDTAGREARPEALTREELSQSDENGLTAICTRIRNHLGKHIRAGETALKEAGITSNEQLKTPRGREILKKTRLSDDGAVSLFEYTMNPRSFGQTVENLFYTSFLIKEGSIGVYSDSNGLPTLSVASPSTLEDKRENKTSKHQAVLALDYSTWQDLVKAFDIREPLIPHRAEEPAAQVGQRGWYT